jgi:pilus assembly protein CpaC
MHRGDSERYSLSQLLLNQQTRKKVQVHKKYKNLILLATLAMTGQSFGQDKSGINQTPSASSSLKPCIGEVRVDPPTYLALGKSRVMQLNFPAARMLVGGQSSSRAGRAIAASDKTANAPTAPAAAQADSDGVADLEITLLSRMELFLLGKKAGSMNVILQSADGRCVVKDIIVTVDPDTLQAKLTELMPEETGIKVKGAENTLVLTGKVSDAIKLDEVMSLATAYGDGKKVINMLRIMAPQQVMLEVKIAEVSKNILERLGFDFTKAYATGNGSAIKILSGLIGGGTLIGGRLGGLTDAMIAGRVGSSLGDVSLTGPVNQVFREVDRFGKPIPSIVPIAGSSSTSGIIDAQKKDGVFRVLAEPNIMSISGQAASFLSGGKIFIPVANKEGTITLEEREFGVGLKFTPTVLDGNRINLKLISEASELSQTGSPFTSINGVTSILPSLTTRRVDTTVQLVDGQSFVVAGLIKNNFTEAVKRFPGVGEVPVVGALFRSTEFQNDQTELMFVVTPRLVKPLTDQVALPTDNHIVPSRSDVMLMGAGEGAPKAATPAANPVTK